MIRRVKGLRNGWAESEVRCHYVVITGAIWRCRDTKWNNTIGPRKKTTAKRSYPRNRRNRTSFRFWARHRDARFLLVTELALSSKEHTHKSSTDQRFDAFRQHRPRKNCSNDEKTFDQFCTKVIFFRELSCACVHVCECLFVR